MELVAVLAFISGLLILPFVAAYGAFRFIPYLVRSFRRLGIEHQELALHGKCTDAKITAIWPGGAAGKRRVVGFEFDVDDQVFTGSVANNSLEVNDILSIAYLPQDPRAHAPQAIITPLREKM